ncbi:hypothetical protein DL766_005660 [Monosporascus sp. MC13-8B]|uniref:Uncharacterized protein n=1 Tax=Monosporascus cannonballus TaxID=155416 RepID=A0ABY0H4Y5_9PEZI|nr:hypothetical protein DL762_005554 [Monosporascus cannonballus]RYO89535.1 hypothetical protein DL763_005635 [Monosporascus cannonballus]RYP28882.1 hypothetical protein DL766_005660 [Monosporascus sp. MC13-8B]
MSLTTSTPSTIATPSVPQTLAGKVAVVSGSNSGIGLAIARELASRGANIVINHPFPSLFADATAVAASLPTKSVAIRADLSTIEGPRTLADATFQEFGHIDILVNNAALAINLPFEEQTMEHWDSLVNLQSRGTFLLTQHTLRYLPPAGGRILNICSVSSRGPPPLQTIYAGTKGMVDSFTRVWAKELPPKYGCTVNAVPPGPTAAEGFLAAGEVAMKEGAAADDRRDTGREEDGVAGGGVCGRIPVRREGGVGERSAPVRQRRLVHWLILCLPPSDLSSQSPALSLMLATGLRWTTRLWTTFRVTLTRRRAPRGKIWGRWGRFRRIEGSISRLAK